MGYDTSYIGSVRVEPPLNFPEYRFLEWFASECHEEEGDFPPSFWCDWVPVDEYTIAWNGDEKFYDGAEWMKYLIDNFLKPGAAMAGDPEFAKFTFDHVVNGVIEAQGEDEDDRWDLVVEDNVVKVRRYETTVTQTTETVVGEPEEI